MSFLTKIFGSRNQRLLKQYQKSVREINALEPQMEALSVSRESCNRRATPFGTTRKLNPSVIDPGRS